MWETATRSNQIKYVEQPWLILYTGKYIRSKRTTSTNILPPKLAHDRKRSYSSEMIYVAIS